MKPGKLLRDDSVMPSSSNHKKRLTLAGQSILVIGTESWFGPLVSKHYLVLELCKRNRVLYLEPFYHVGGLLRGQLPRYLYHEAYHDEQPPTLSRLLPLRLPKTQSSLLARRLSEAVVIAQLRARRFRPDLIISFSPYFAFMAGKWGAPFIYYCVDTQIATEAEAETLDRADLVIAATEVLYNRFKGRTKQLKYLPHGINLDIIKAHTGQPAPEMAELPRPIAGFVGSINEHFDSELIEKLAQAAPKLSIVLIGPYAKNSYGDGIPEEKLARLRAFPNIYLFGPRPSAQLGAYINAFDVGLVPKDLRNPFAHFSYSKVLQYTALGKPVVTTCPARDSILPPAVTVADNPADFIKAVNRAVTSHDTVASNKCYAFARENTWESRVAELSGWIEAGI